MCKPARITLNDDEIQYATSVGNSRHEESIASGRTSKLGDTDTRQSHVMGAIGELAAAKYLGVRWRASVGTFKTVPDVGRYEVKAVSGAHHRLLMNANEKTDPYILAHVKGHECDLLGWITMEDALKVCYMDDPGNRGKPCRCVDQKDLKDPATLPELVSTQ